MKTAQQWLDQYGESHQNPTNERIHWVCIPLIVVSLLGLLAYVGPFGFSWLNGATLLLGVAILWYARLSKPLAIGMLLVGAGALGVVALLSSLPIPLWISSILIFVGAWIAQFIGHKIEGKKPSFLEDLQFLLVGPLWLLCHVYRRLGLSY